MWDSLHGTYMHCRGILVVLGGIFCIYYQDFCDDKLVDINIVIAMCLF